MKTRYLTLPALLAISLSASAQDLVKEIDVDRTIVPQEREAVRPAAPSPSIFTPKVKPVELTTADRFAPSTLTPMMTIPQIASWGGTQPLTPYRGYITGGYLPIYNPGINAGYELISTSRSQLGAWVSYTGDSYKYHSDKYNNHFFGVGVAGSHSFNANAALSADLTFRHDAFTTPFVSDGKQGASILDFHTAFLGKNSSVSYTVNADVQHFAFADALWAVADVQGKAMKQTQIKVGGDATLSIPALGSLRPGASLSFDALLSNNLPKPSATGLTTGTGTYGILRFDPYMLFGGGEFKGKIGLNLSIGMCDQSKMAVAPNLQLAYNPASLPIDIWASVGGGMGQNRIYDLYERDYTTTPPLALKSYNIPLSARAGVNVMPVSGLRMGLHIGYAITRDMAIPWLNVPVQPDMATAYKLDGLNAGVEASYTHSLFTLRAAYEAATSSSTDPNKGWYLWRDRAKSALSGAVKVRPLDRLTVTLSYLGRYGRHTFAPLTPSSVVWQKVSTRDISSLNIGAKYTFSPSLSFFANVENILNHRYYFSSTVPAPGVTGLLGAEYKF